MHIVDRRLNPGSKSLENRQRFLRRAKALVQGAVKKSSQDRDIKDVLEGGEVSIPLDGMNEPRFRREGGTRDMVLPGNKKFIEGDMLPRSGEGSGKASRAGRRRQRGCVPVRSEPRRIRRPVPRRSRIARSRQAQARRSRKRGACTAPAMRPRLARQHFGQPHGAPGVGAAGRAAAAAAGGRSRGLRRRLAGCDEARRAELLAEIDSAEGESSAGFRSSIRSTSATAASRPCRSRWRRP